MYDRSSKKSELKKSELKKWREKIEERKSSKCEFEINCESVSKVALLIFLARTVDSQIQFVILVKSKQFAWINPKSKLFTVHQAKVD